MFNESTEKLEYTESNFELNSKISSKVTVLDCPKTDNGKSNMRIKVFIVVIFFKYMKKSSSLQIYFQ
jgi:hypothetical protein